MARFLYRVGQFCAARALYVLLAWVVLAVVLVGLKSQLGSLTSNDQTLPGTQSQQASDLLARYFPPQQNGSSPIVFHVRKGKITDKANKDAVESSYKALLKAPDVYSATDPFGKSSSVLVSKDGHTAWTPVLLKISNGQVTEALAQRIFNATRPAQKQGIEVAAGGTIGSALSPSPTEKSEVVGLLTAMLVLALTFGSLVAMGLPILTAIVGLTTALSVIGLLTHVLTVPTVGPTLATMIGLGVGIDYSLFMVNKYREHHGRGAGHREAIALSVATAGSAIVFAGTTVVIALVSLTVAGIPLVTTLGLVTAVAVLTAVLAALTLLPAVMSLLGKHLFGGKLPAFLRPRSKPHKVGFWGRWAGLVTGHPWVWTLVAVAILAPLIVPLFSLHLGQEDIGVTPTSTTERQAFDLLSAGFGPGYNGPLLVAVKLSPPATESQQYADQYNQAKALQKDLQNKQQTLTAQSNSLKAQQASLQNQQAQLKAQSASLQAQQAALEAQKGPLTARQQQLLAEEEQLTREKSQLLAQEASLQQQSAALAAQIRANRVAFAELTAKLNVILRAEQRIGAGLAAHGCTAHPDVPPCPALSRALTAAQGAETTTRNQLAANQAQFGQLEQQAAALKQQANALAAKAAKLQQQANALAAQGAALMAQANSLQAQGTSLQNQANSLQSQGASLQQQGDSLQAQADSLQAQQQQANNEQKQALALQQQLTDELTYAGGDDRGTDPRLVQLENALATPKGVYKVSPPNINKKGDAATFSVIPTTRPAAVATANLVTQLRTTVIPAATRDPHHATITAYVGGVTAGNVDLAAKISSKLFEVIAVVLALSFILLMIAFRSLLIPLQAAITNLLCVGAAFGVLTATFQWGWGLHVVGLASPYGTVPIASYVPLMMFAALFGLSMDYEVFLVSQIAAHHAAGEEPRQAVRSGLAASAKVIAAAATIMIAVFGSFILNADPTVKQFGVGLSVAVLLAGTMTLLLAPALLDLFGRRTWALPRWLAKVLPRIDIEGENAPHAQPTAPVPELAGASAHALPPGTGPLAVPTATPRPIPGEDTQPVREPAVVPQQAAEPAPGLSLDDLLDGQRHPRPAHLDGGD
jgi:uncharacterized membrane protein YdfJ with MMPL/SSD domain